MAYGKTSKVVRRAAARPYSSPPRHYRPDSCKVYVGSLSYMAKWQDLKDHMKQAGKVTHVAILTEDGTDSGRSRGTGIVEYDTEEEAKHAIKTLAESDFMGRNLFVEPWTGSSGYFRGKPKSSKGKAGGKGAGHRGGSKDKIVNGDPELLVYVGNLSYKVEWQDLKEYMSKAGTVEFCEVLTEADGRSRGIGCVRYSTAEEADTACATLAETKLMGRAILVDHWASKKD